jgi:hypothetical protein
MENKVIQLPKVLNWQKQWRDHFHERKASVAVSIASILVFSLFLNQWLISPSLTMAGAGQRGIASVGLSAEDYKNTVKWEHELADQVAGSRRNVAHLSEKPNLRDELLFGALGGRYGVQFEQGKVLSIESPTAKNSLKIIAAFGPLILRMPSLKVKPNIKRSTNCSARTVPKKVERCWTLIRTVILSVLRSSNKFSIPFQSEII